MQKNYFHLAQFAETDFYGARFKENVDFGDTRFTEKVDFHNVQFDDQEHTFFLTDDLSHVSFVNTDISRVKFGENVMWGDKFKIREEREIEERLTTTAMEEYIRLGSVLAVYRSLRENYEYRMRYDEAGEFFIREMEMKRTYKEVSLKRRKSK